MYNLIENSKKYSKTSENLWNYYRDEPNSGLGGENNNVNYFIKDSNYFDYKTKITSRVAGIDTTKDVVIVVPLKYLSKFSRTIDMRLINCEVSLTLS